MNAIRFPHLGIILQNVPHGLWLCGFEITCYGLVIAAAAVSGLWIVTSLEERSGRSGDEYLDYGIVTILVSVLCARIYYVIFSWDYYRYHLAEIIDLRSGGLAIYGGVLGGIFCTFCFARIRKKPVLQLLDTAVSGLSWGQMIGRWGNFFNREAFGEYTDSLFAMQIPLSRVNSSHITGRMLEHLVQIDGVSYIQVHPAFLYESVWDLLVFLVLLFLFRRRPKRKQGISFFLYLVLYGCGRFVIEQIRTDQLMLTGTALPVSQILSAILAAVGVSGIIFISYFKRRKQ